MSATLQIILIVIWSVLIAIVAFFVGLVVGSKGVKDIQRQRQRERDFAGVQERWAGHVSHRGHKFISPEER